MTTRKAIYPANQLARPTQNESSDESPAWNSTRAVAEFEQLYECYKRTGYKLLAAIQRAQEHQHLIKTIKL